MREAFSNFFVGNTIARAARVLDPRDRRRVLLVIFLQISFGLLDLAGVAIVGVLGALAVTGVQGQLPGNRVSILLEFLNLEDLSLQSQVAILGATAATLLISKTIFSVIFTRKIMFFLSRRAAVISGSLISKILNQNLLQVQKRSNQEFRNCWSWYNYLRYCRHDCKSNFRCIALIGVINRSFSG